MKSFPLALAIGLAVASVFGPASAAEEPPILAEDIAAGRLPPLAQRLPQVPRRDLPTRPDWRPGRYGGTLTTLSRTGRDPRDMTVLGYARLVAWDEAYRLVPDILARFEVEEGRRFTLHLRPGHRWSDGAPFTTEDIRFWWDQVAKNPVLSPSGPPAALLAGGRPPEVEVLGPTAVRFTWTVANRQFLPALAGTSPPFIYRPAHYLKAFHPGHTDREALDRTAKDRGFPGWAARFEQLDQPFRQSNPDRPSLQPWVNTTAAPSERYVGRRNPFFHRVDGTGRQLPYIDRLVIARSDRRLIAAKVAAGDATLQATGLAFGDFTLLKEAEARSGIKARLWPIGRGTQLALYPNLNAADPTWRALMRSLPFRRALSLAIDRQRIVQAVYQGLAQPRANTVLPASPLHRMAFASAWAEHDAPAANRLLDGLGLERRDGDGVRTTADGTRLELIVAAGDSDPAEVDVLEQIAASWREVGIRLVVRSAGRQAFRRDVRSGRSPMSIFYGLANGLADAGMRPTELAPSSGRQNNWPHWGRFAETGGAQGEAPALPAVLRLLDLLGSWDRAETDEDRKQIWDEMLTLHADQVFTIGIVGEVRQAVVADAALRNLPDRAFFMYEPGAYFGLTRPDTYFFE